MTTNEIKNLVLNINKENANKLMAQCKQEALSAGMTEQEADKKAFEFVMAAWLGKTKYN